MDARGSRADGEPVHDVQATLIERSSHAPPRRRRRSRRGVACRMRHDAHGYWIEEAGLEPPADPLPAAAAATSRPTSSSSAAATPASGRRWWLKRQTPTPGSSCSRPTAAASARAAATAASSTRCRSACRRCGRAFGDERAIEMVHAGDESVHADRPLVRGAGGRRLVHPRRLPAGLDLAALRRHLGPGRRRVRGARRGGPDRGPRPRSGAGPLRLARFPRRRLLPGRRHRPAGAARRRPAGAAARGRRRDPRATRRSSR